MNDIVTKFELFIEDTLQVTPATCSAYKRDIQDFIAFAALYITDITLLTANLITLYIQGLHKQAVSVATAYRKLSVLRLFCNYLQQVYSLPDYSPYIILEKKLPILGEPERVKALIQLFAHTNNYQELSYKELRNLLLLRLLQDTQLTIAQVITLKKSNFCFKTHAISVALEKKTYYKELSPTIFNVLVWYLKKRPSEFYDTDYIFCIKIGHEIKPLSRPAAWALIKAMLQEPTKTLEYSGGSCQSIADDLKIIYKKHPRL